MTRKRIVLIFLTFFLLIVDYFFFNIIIGLFCIDVLSLRLPRIDEQGNAVPPPSSSPLGFCDAQLLIFSLLIVSILIIIGLMGMWIKKSGRKNVVENKPTELSAPQVPDKIQT